ncbi:MAG: transglutaminase family protein [Candidatus Omnitrophica bacterium]|nr:transglutaminase family protein [Candidatus Omnitrophota bacterium]MCB9767540.1 transglutaminase family protein [Candidatus Omnitrophota bacterium]
MQFRIDHKTTYSYTAPVFLEPFAVRLRPKTDINQRLLEFELEIDPIPTGRTEVNDLDGNVTALLWFSDLHDHLRIRSRSVVETCLDNPFNFLIADPDCQSIPVSYSKQARESLRAYREPLNASSEPVRKLLDEVSGSSSSNETITFLSQLCRVIHSRVTPVLRHEGAPYSPEESLEKGTGACRDLAVLFIEACRHVGLASRFVSGYHEVSSELPAEHLHAWAEVYLPGGGWRGFDPTNGFAVADRHVAVATGASPEHAAPTSGSFRGTGVESQMSVELTIETS